MGKLTPAPELEKINLIVFDAVGEMYRLNGVPRMSATAMSVALSNHERIAQLDRATTDTTTRIRLREWLLDDAKTASENDTSVGIFADDDLADALKALAAFFEEK